MKMNSGMCRAITAHNQQNATLRNDTKLVGCRFTVHMDKEPKHTLKASQGFFFNANEYSMAKSPDLHLTEDALYLLRTNLRTEKSTMFMGSRPQGAKDFHPVLKDYGHIYNYVT